MKRPRMKHHPRSFSALVRFATWSAFKLVGFRLLLVLLFRGVVFPRLGGFGSLKANSKVTPPVRVCGCKRAHGV